MRIPKVLIGLSGYAGAGKDVVADALVDTRGFEKVTIVDPLNRALSQLIDIPAEDMLDGEVKSKAIPWLPKQPPWHRRMLGCLPEYHTVRDLQITLGTEWGRDLVHPDFWVKLLVRRLSQVEYAVVPNVRFQNEVDCIHRMGGEVWLVDRPSKRPPKPAWWQRTLGSIGLYRRGHISERIEDLRGIDYVLTNDAGIGSLQGDAYIAAESRLIAARARDNFEKIEAELLAGSGT